MSGVITSEGQFEHCNACAAQVHIDTLEYEPKSEAHPYGRDLCQSCAAGNPPLTACDCGLTFARVLDLRAQQQPMPACTTPRRGFREPWHMWLMPNDLARHVARISSAFTAALNPIQKARGAPTQKETNHLVGSAIQILQGYLRNNPG